MSQPSLKQVIPDGYKQTEVGVIPDDWDAINFGELFESCVSRKLLKPETITTFIGMQDVSENAQLVSPSYKLYKHVKSGFTYFEKKDILLAKITPCFENGKGCYTQNLRTQIGFGSTEFHVLRAKKNADPQFIYFWTTRNSLRHDLEGEMVGSAGHRRVPFSAIQNYKVPCPRKHEEQTAIANALSDVDLLLSELEKLISKKQAIKTATMQQLLTGKTRLPQFAYFQMDDAAEGELKNKTANQSVSQTISQTTGTTTNQGKKKGTKPSELGEIPEDWEVASASDLINFMGGYGFSSRLATDSGIKWLKIANVGLNKIKWDADSYLPKSLADNFNNYLLGVNDVVMALTRPLLNDKLKVARLKINDLPALLNQRVAKLTPKGKNNLNYIYYVVQRAEFIAEMNLAMAGTDPPNIGTTALGNINILIPSSPAEQTAIATILSDMDEEIQALTKRLSKTRQIKQGMMQELLTGKTRLIKGEAHD